MHSSSYLYKILVPILPPYLHSRFSTPSSLPIILLYISHTSPILPLPPSSPSHFSSTFSLHLPFFPSQYSFPIPPPPPSPSTPISPLSPPSSLPLIHESKHGAAVCCTLLRYVNKMLILNNFQEPGTPFPSPPKALLPTGFKCDIFVPKIWCGFTPNFD
jgi:hypothetical protein